MALIAKPIETHYRNKGEYGYSIGVTVVDEDGVAVDITGDVKILYIDLAGKIQQLIGSKSDNVAFYAVLITDFTVSGTYKYWVQCFDNDIYGPFELKIMDIS